MAREPCYCAATDCPICGPLQGYPVRRKSYGLSAEDCDILNADALHEALQHDEEDDVED